MNRAPTQVFVPPIKRESQHDSGVDEIYFSDSGEETDSDQEMEDMSLLDIIKNIHLLFKKSLDLSLKFNNALEGINELESIEKKNVLKA